MKIFKSLLFLPLLFTSSCENTTFPSFKSEEKETYTKEEIDELLKSKDYATKEELLEYFERLRRTQYNSNQLISLIRETLSEMYSSDEVDHLINSMDGERVVESYRSDYNYYRIYSDNWIEQGGRVAVKENSSTTITLKKEMKDAKYTMQVMNNSSHTSSNAEGVLTGVIVSSKQIKITAGYIDPNSTNAFWEVKGFMKVEE